MLLLRMDQVSSRLHVVTFFVDLVPLKRLAALCEISRPITDRLLAVLSLGLHGQVHRLVHMLGEVADLLELILTVTRAIPAMSATQVQLVGVGLVSAVLLEHGHSDLDGLSAKWRSFGSWLA